MGTPADCSSLAETNTCLGETLARRVCETFGQKVSPDVASAWLACLRTPGTDLCNTRSITACGLTAVKTACVDRSYRDVCAKIAADCADFAPEISAPICEALASAWKPEVRQELIDCLRSSCQTGGFGACLP